MRPISRCWSHSADAVPRGTQGWVLFAYLRSCKRGGDLCDVVPVVSMAPIWAFSPDQNDIFAPAVWLWNYVGKVIEARSEQRGQLTFSFKKPEYALEFMRLNQEGDERSQKPREAALESFRLNQ